MSAGTGARGAMVDGEIETAFRGSVSRYREHDEARAFQTA